MRTRTLYRLVASILVWFMLFENVNMRVIAVEEKPLVSVETVDRAEDVLPSNVGKNEDASTSNTDKEEDALPKDIEADAPTPDTDKEEDALSKDIEDGVSTFDMYLKEDTSLLDVDEDTVLSNMVGEDVSSHSDGIIYTKYKSTMGTGGSGTEADPYDSLVTALEVAQDGDTIILQGTGFYNDFESNGEPIIINHAITIEGEHGDGSDVLDTRAGGILLGADVTIRNLTLLFENGSRNAIFANGYKLILENVAKHASGRSINAFAGGLDGYESISAGSCGEIILKGKTCIENIYAGAYSNAHSMPWNKPAKIVVGSDVYNSDSSKMSISASGAYQQPFDSLVGGFAGEEPTLPENSADAFPVTAGVEISIGTALVKQINGKASENQFAKIYYHNEGYATSGVLLDQIGDIEVDYGKIIPDIGSSFGTNLPDITVGEHGYLDLSGFGSTPTINDYDGNGKLILGSEQTLTIQGSVSGQTTFGIGEIFNDKSGNVALAHDYIIADKSVEGSFVFAGCSDSQPGVLLSFQEGKWSFVEGAVDDEPLPTITCFRTNVAEYTINGENFVALEIPFYYEIESEMETYFDISYMPLDVEVKRDDNTVYGESVLEETFYESIVSDYNMHFSWQGEPEDEESVAIYLECLNQQKIPDGEYFITITVPKEYTENAENMSICLTLKVGEHANGSSSDGDGDSTGANNGNSEAIWGDITSEDRIAMGYESIQDVPEDLWVCGLTNQTYTGEWISFDTLHVYYHTTRLIKNRDYVLNYKNNRDVQDAQALNAPAVTVELRGQYAGERTYYFSILPREIDPDEVLGYEQVVVWNEIIEISSPKFHWNNRILEENKDFICDYSSLPQPYTDGNLYDMNQTYEYTVYGIGNFTGSFVMQLTLISDKKHDFSRVAVSFNQKQYEYHGVPLQKEDVGIASVKIGFHELDSSLYDYQIDATGVGIGIATIYPSSQGREAGYRGCYQAQFKVVGDRDLSLAELDIDWSEQITFSQTKINVSGGMYQNEVGVLKYPTQETYVPLQENRDYIVRYDKHKSVGIATITFEGIGRYFGTLKKTYRILPNEEIMIHWMDCDEKGKPIAYYQKGGTIPSLEVLECPGNENAYRLSPVTDYAISFQNNKRLGKMTCRIVGKGNYVGYKSVTELEIVPGDLSTANMVVKDQLYTEKADGWKSPVTITDRNGKTLVAGLDYKKELDYTFDGMEEQQTPSVDTEIQVIATGINNYSGSQLVGSYHIYAKSLESLVIEIDPQEYSGKEITLSDSAIHVYANKTDASLKKEVLEKSYEIVSYKDNLRVGIASVILRGIGNYGGTRKCSFRIQKKEVKTVRVTDICLNKTELFLPLDWSETLLATVLPEDAINKTLTWRSADETIAIVDDTGTVTGLEPGSTTITVISQDTGKKVNCIVHVAKVPVSAISLNASEIRQNAGTQFQLSAHIEPEYATHPEIEWETGNERIATVDENGLVSLHRTGMTVITAYTDERDIYATCLVCVNQAEIHLEEGTYLTPQMYRTASQPDDTQSFNEAIKHLGGNCKTLYVPSGEYRINPLNGGIQLKDDIKIIMEPDAVLKAINNSSRGYDVISAQYVSNVTVMGGQIVGERYGHSGTDGEYGMGIGLYDSDNIQLVQIEISDCWGDGIYLGSRHEEDYKTAGCKQISIMDCYIHGNRRNNLSIVCADDVVVYNSSFDDARGTSPERGIDIEPNIMKNPCEHITISKCMFDGNEQGSIGILSATGILDNVYGANDINILDCELNGVFTNYAGKNVTVSNSKIRGEVDARFGIHMTGGTVINDGSDAEDILVAEFNPDIKQFSFGRYRIDGSNPMLLEWKQDDLLNQRVLHVERQTAGTAETGVALNLSEMSLTGATALVNGADYRFEYSVKGTGIWGTKSSQTGWYPVMLQSDKYTTGVVTYGAGTATSCQFYLYAIDRIKGMYADVENVKIYQVR